MLGDLSAARKEIAYLVRAPRRISVSEAAKEVVRIEVPGGYSGNWDPELTPYMVEPMDMLKSLRHEAVIFVSPARTGKTQALIDGWLAHCVTADPGDMGLYFSTQNLAYDYRKRRIERLHNLSPSMRAKLSQRKHDTTVEMVIYRNGMILNLGWPTSSQLAQRDLRYVALSDYDSFPDDIAGEGSPFDLAKKRIQVAGYVGMALVESSPKRMITVANYKLDHPHEAPPVDGGILPLYNRGTMARWKWKCIDGCGDRFEAPHLPAYDENGSNAHVACPHCGTVYGPRRKKALNAAGSWCHAKEARSASYWLLGTAAAFQSWDDLVSNYLSARRHAEISNDETSLTSTTNLDQGMPYKPMALEAIEGEVDLQSRPRDETERFYVPRGVRCLIATVDVQKWSFQVAVWGHGVDNQRWLVDRFSINRDDEGNKIRPAIHTEAWKILKQRVVESDYRIDDDIRMRVFAVGIDSGGEEGVTERAYGFWRWIRAQGLGTKVRLIKGEGSKNSPLIRETVPDSSKRAGRPGGGAGDVPVLILNVHKLKDICFADLAVAEPGPNYMTLPAWTPKSVFDELTAEQRDEKEWKKISGRSNETWDLMVYDRAIWSWIGGDSIKWDSPPAWAQEWTKNPLVGSRLDKEVKRRVVSAVQPRRQRRIVR